MLPTPPPPSLPHKLCSLKPSTPPLTSPKTPLRFFWLHCIADPPQFPDHCEADRHHRRLVHPSRNALKRGKALPTEEAASSSASVSLSRIRNEEAASSSSSGPATSYLRLLTVRKNVTFASGSDPTRDNLRPESPITILVQTDAGCPSTIDVSFVKECIRGQGQKPRGTRVYTLFLIYYIYI